LTHHYLTTICIRIHAPERDNGSGRTFVGLGERRVLSHESDRVPVNEPLPNPIIQTKHPYLVRDIIEVDVDTVWKTFSGDEGLKVGKH